MGIRLGRSPDQVIKSSSLMGEKSMEFSCFPQERGGLEDGRQRGWFHSDSGLVLICIWKEERSSRRMELRRHRAGKLSVLSSASHYSPQAPASPQPINTAPIVYMRRLRFRNIKWEKRHHCAASHQGWPLGTSSVHQSRWGCAHRQQARARCQTKMTYPFHVDFLPLIRPTQVLLRLRFPETHRN